MSKYLFLLLLLLAASLCAQTPAADSAFIRDNFNKKEVMIPMRDGIKLFTTIYSPKNKDQKYPILLNRTPYSCAPYGKDAYRQNFQNMELARAGYIFVYQDVRGRYMSEGEFMDVRPFNPDKQKKTDIDEASDTYDTVDWLLKNAANNNGRVGVYGISYPGFYSTMAILAGHPAIKAVSPQAPVTDWFKGDDFHHNGAFCLMDAFAFYYAAGFGLGRTGPETKHGRPFTGWNTPDNYQFYLKTGALPNFKTRFVKDSVPFWDSLMAHPNYDAWWQARNPRPHLKDVQPAVMTVGGLFDAEDCYGAWNVYKAIEKQNPRAQPNYLVMGPWVHGGWARTEGDHLGRVHFDQKTAEYYKSQVELPFFEYYLKDKGTLEMADALVFQTGENEWKRWSQWPPIEAQPVIYYFQEKGGLSTEAPLAFQGFDEYLSDPNKPVPYTEDVHLRRTNTYMCDDQRFASRRPDVLSFQTEVLKQKVAIDGPITAEIYLSSTGSDADLVVKLIDVYPDTLSKVEDGVPMGGYQMLVRGEIMRTRYRNSFERPEQLYEGNIHRIKFELPDVAHTFLPGHRIMIQVQSSWFPLMDRNPQKFVNIYQASDDDFVKANHRIYRSGRNLSNVTLSVVR